MRHVLRLTGFLHSRCFEPSTDPTPSSESVSRLTNLLQSAAPLCEATTHNASQQRAPRFSMPFCECAQSSWTLHCEIGDFWLEFGEGGGLKNRRRFDGKSWIRQVLISRTLSVCGEVAERLKAAVC
jgi:hypothetical protein